MGDTATSTAIATVIATIITAGAALVTQRSATRAAVRNAEVTSRTDIEKEAFERAKLFYTDTIDRQDRAIETRDRKIETLESKVDELEGKVDEQEHEIRKLRDDLDVARRALEMRFPDEP
ncbi:MAG TPA: hypothetical protein VFH54_06920 [Mycobacteriales bacterium]|nr:hypothetical protein [Mycobacteriales bacterium]